MKTVTYLAFMASMAWLLPGALMAEEGKEAAHRDGERKEGERKEGDRKDGERRDEVREFAGNFVKSTDGMPNFKSGEATYGVVLGQNADDSTKEKLTNFEKVLVNKDSWGVKGTCRKDASGKDWIAIDWIGKRDEPEHKKDGERKEGGDDRKKWGDRKHMGGDHKSGDHK